MSRMNKTILVVTILFLVLALSGCTEEQEPVTLTTDKIEYQKGETITVTVKNNSSRPIWYNLVSHNCVPNLGLMGKQNENWEHVPLLPFDIDEQCRTTTNKLEPGDSINMEYSPALWHDPNFLNFSHYKLGFGYAFSEGTMESLPAYSNEFTISGVEEKYYCDSKYDCVPSDFCYNLEGIAECVNENWWFENYGVPSCPAPQRDNCACVDNRCTMNYLNDSLIVSTDMEEYYESETVQVMVLNNSDSSVWYKVLNLDACDMGATAMISKGPLQLERYRLYSGLPGGEWIPVPSSTDSLGEECGYAMYELKTGQFQTFLHFLELFYEAEFKTSKYDPLLTSRYRLAIEYATVNDVTKTENGYSNEFSILHETECERIERQTPLLVEEIKTCDRDSECIVDDTITPTSLAGCFLIRSNQYDSSMELDQLWQDLFSYATECESIDLECAVPPESLECKDYECVEADSSNGNGSTTYPPNTDSEEDRLAVESVYHDYIDAGQSCDIELATAIITERTKEIVYYTCSNMFNESKCYVDMDYEILTKPDIAVVYLTPYSHNIENPFFFSRENGEWKLDLYRMAFGMAMAGSTCHSGWGWTNLELRDEFCSYFPENECPDEW